MAQPNMVLNVLSALGLNCREGKRLTAGKWIGQLRVNPEIGDKLEEEGFRVLCRDRKGGDGMQEPEGLTRQLIEGLERSQRGAKGTEKINKKKRRKM